MSKCQLDQYNTLLYLILDYFAAIIQHAIANGN